MAVAEHDTPRFARTWIRTSEKGERRGAAEHRHRLLDGLSGEVVEIGAGHGLNFAHLPATVTRLVALEPERNLREAAAEAARSAPVPVEVLPGVADRIPAPDGAFDAAIASLVLCSVPDQARALAEIRRVLRPGGELRFYEHVVARSRPMRTFQRVADATIWPRLACGCHLARDTRAAIEAAGFTIAGDVERFGFAPERWQPAMPHIIGRAVAGGSP